MRTCFVSGDAAGFPAGVAGTTAPATVPAASVSREAVPAAVVVPASAAGRVAATAGEPAVAAAAFGVTSPALPAPVCTAGVPPAAGAGAAGAPGSDFFTRRSRFGSP